VSDVKSLRELCYATVDGEDLCLDLHIPATPDAVLVVYAHGGGFQLGDKADAVHERLLGLAGYGVAVASINYRHAPRALFPAQIHDMKAAVRWLRGNGGGYGLLRTDRIGVWGASAGGYLATMVALSAGDLEFEGDVGGDVEQSSAVQAAVIWFAPSDLASSGRRSPLERQILFPSFEAAVLGLDDVTGHPASTSPASALARVSASAPPFLIAHGDSDRMVPPSESAALHDALGRGGVTSTLMSLAGAGHEDPAFDRPELHAMTAAWLRAILLAEGAGG
jgi:acetyl esterase/lipase